MNSWDPSLQQWMRSWVEPSLLISETHFPWMNQHDTVIAAIERLVQDPFYRRVEWMVDDLPPHCAQHLRKLVREHGVELLLWSPPAIDSPACSLSSLDPAARRRGVEIVQRLIDCAAACGATTVCIRSGPDVNPAERSAAIAALSESVILLSEHCRQAGVLKLFLEPLDQFAHKRMLLGSSTDAVKLAEAVRAQAPEFALCWDSGHTLLNGEDWSESLHRCWPHLGQLHLSNPVLDPNHPWFGDTHVCVGQPPGVVDMAMVTSILKSVRQLCQRDGRRIAVAIEERNWPGTAPEKFVRHTQQVLLDACTALYAMEHP